MVHLIILISFAPKTGAKRIVPKIGVMKNPRLSIHSTEHMKLRQLLIRQRLDLGLSQRALAEKLDVVHSFIGKVETGDMMNPLAIGRASIKRRLRALYVKKA